VFHFKVSCIVRALTGQDVAAGTVMYLLERFMLLSIMCLCVEDVSSTVLADMGACSLITL